jgi:hypothetical protein
MPSILHRSAESLDRTGYALTDSSIAYQQNGLVNASMTYVAAPLQNGREVERVFAVDSAPVAPPPALNAQALQGAGLFLQSATSDTAYGITTVNAQYVGALRISREGVVNFVTTGFERGTVTAEVTAAIVSTSTLVEGGALEGGGTRSFSTIVKDFYRFAYRSRIAVAEAATLGNNFVFRIPPLTSDSNPALGMIVSWELISKRLGFIPEADENTTVDLLLGSDLRGETNLGWLTLLSDAATLPFGQLPIRVGFNEEISPVTPTVKILRKRASVLAPARYIL